MLGHYLLPPRRFSLLPPPRIFKLHDMPSEGGHLPPQVTMRFK